ncbi:MAG: DUF89 family protein, partial [Candidatus Methanomethylophilus sp.]|nr:DUF89 family protein [Methanomethylophilus sp.]
YSIMGVSDPYRTMKEDADRVVERYIPQAEEFIRSSPDRFRAAVQVSIIGNIMDFGSGIAIDDPEEFGRMFDGLLAEGIGSDETDALRELVDASDTVLYAFDNCGEGLLDRFLIREIRAMGKRVVGVVRGKPVLNDVSMEDALRAGLDRELDRIVTTGDFAIGFPREFTDPGFLEEYSRAGVMICKGMANYESLSDRDLPVPTAFLLRAKCRPVAASLNVPVGTNTVRIKRAL